MTFAPVAVRRSLIVALALLAGAASPSCPAPAHAGGMLVGYEEAARLGLERTWFAQVPLDPSRSRVSNWYLYFDRLYCVTDSGLITAINAETGAKIWTRQIGRSGAEAFGPDANANYLGLVSGSRVYILERDTGRIKWSRELGGAPSSGPALSRDYAYVALATGRIEAYRIDDDKLQPWYYQSDGRTHLQPTTTGRVVTWPTSKGYIYASLADDPGILYRLETGDDIFTSPAEMSPNIYLASLDGYLYCLNELNGHELWRYSTGFPITSSPAIVEKHAYVASIEPVLHCIDSSTGAPLWTLPGAKNFAAEGRERVYAADQYNHLLVLETKTGALVGRLNLADGTKTVVNDQTDRIFLVNDHGLVQCLREIGAVEPILHRKASELVAADEEAAEAAGVARPGPAGAEEPGAEPSVFDDEPPADQPAAGDEGAEPAEEPAAPADEVEENPFGDF